MEAFPSLCVSLASCYIFFAAVSVFQLGRIVEREQGVASFDPRAWLWPITVQQQIHLIVFLLSSVRVAFFFVAMVAWDSSGGVLKSHKVEFYSLDEFATVLFFTLASVLALFWAELYYISTDSPEIFTSVIKPYTYVINGAAFIAVALITALAASTTFTQDDTDFIFTDYTILAASVYCIGAGMFAYFAWAVAAELKEVPIQLSARRNRLGVLRYLAAIVIIALLVKAIILIYITGKSVVTEGDAAVVGVFLYYFLLELCPLFVILVFYRVEGSKDELEEQPCYTMGQGSTDDDGLGSERPRASHEKDALLYAPGGGSLAGEGGKTGSGGGVGGGGGGGGSKRTISPIRSMPRYDKNLTAPAEVVNQIIARLSWGVGNGGGDEASGGSGQGLGLGMGSSSGSGVGTGRL